MSKIGRPFALCFSLLLDTTELRVFEELLSKNYIGSLLGVPLFLDTVDNIII